MTDEEKSRELTRSSFAAQMAMLGYEPNGNPKDMVELVLCKDCSKRRLCCIRRTDDPEWFCGDGEREDENG